MDTASWFTGMNVVLVVSGMAIGMVAGYFASPAIGQARFLRLELDRLLKEHESYKGSVNAHFRKTADLVGQMTKSYAAVYDHLAGGARTFCEDAGGGQKLPFGPLPGELASPVVETVPEGPGTSTWPTDIAMGDATDQADAGEVATNSLDSRSETTTSFS